MTAQLRTHILQHSAAEGPGHLLPWLRDRGSVTTTVLEHSPELPQLDSFDNLVILGGPMSVNDEVAFPWLRAEKKLIAEAIQSNKKVFGICLGSQLIATVLGASVKSNEHNEIGWFPVEVVTHDSPITAQLPRSFMAFHWHGETFSLPEGAKALFRSAACENQGFSFGTNVLALQFHPEADETLIAAMMVLEPTGTTNDRPFVQSEATLLSQMDRALYSRDLLHSLLKNWSP